MVSEYLLRDYPNFATRTAVPLGAIDDKLAATQGMARAIGMSRPYRPEADALVFLPRHLVLIEAKVWNVINGLSKLPLYKSLLPVTPELAQYRNYEIIMELVVGQTNSNLETMAASLGVRVKLYNPAWLQDVVAGINHYWTKEYQEERQRIIETRRTFGLE